MRNFVILFNGREGTTPLVRLLDNFPRISILHQVDGGWEPFDAHQRRAMPLSALVECLDGVLGPRPVDLDAVNAIYARWASGPLAPVDPGAAIGFKMRFRWRYRAPDFPPSVPGLDRVVRKVGRPVQARRYRRSVVELLRRHGVVVFVAVRQDVFRLGLSKYHGDGSGGAGHLQFKLASGEISRDDLGPIAVDCDRLGRIIDELEHQHARKRALVDELRGAGITVAPLRYEEFLSDKPAYFRRLGRIIGADITGADVERAVRQGSHLQKVHPDDVSDFVTNHEEVVRRFGHRFVPWPAEVPAPSAT